MTAQQNPQKGKLKIFLGMCPGVGKTYSMLEAAQQLKTSSDIVVGIVETHGRKDTEALLQGLKIIERKTINYRDTQLTEMDLDAIIAGSPDYVLVDELAHTNAPGSRHLKRYQDVLELVDNGISVLTTLNVQHLESRAEVVKQITGANVRETVPDSIIDGANEIEIVDLTPGQLLIRLQEGKVYLGDRAENAALNFFKPENLVALREMALRVTAERVDHDLQRTMRDQRISGPWRSSDRLLVAVGPSPHSASLVRYVRRAAEASNCPWLAVHVDIGLPLTQEDSHRLNNNLALARELGAEVINCTGSSIADTLIRIAKEHNVSQIVTGKPDTNSFFRYIRGRIFYNRLLKISGDIDICAVRPIAAPVQGDPLDTIQQLQSGINWKGWKEAMAILLLFTVTNYLLDFWLSYHTLALIYIIGVVVAAIRCSRWPTIACAIGSSLAWNFMFVPPHYTLAIGSADDQIMFIIFILVGGIVGHITAELRRKETIERRQEKQTAALLELTNNVALAPNIEIGMKGAVEQIHGLFKVEAAIYVRSERKQQGLSDQPHSTSSFQPTAKEFTVANWVFENRKLAGKDTETLPEVPSLWIPLIARNEAVGVLGIRSPKGNILRDDEIGLLKHFALQLGLLLEKEYYIQEAHQAEARIASEKLRRSIFDSVSHELKTPIATIQSAIDGVKQNSTTSFNYVSEIEIALFRLNRVVDNLLDMSRIETGAVKPRLEWCELNELIEETFNSVGSALKTHKVAVQIPAEFPMIKVDPVLFERALANLLLNAAVHTPNDTGIELTAAADRREFKISVSDHGPGIPDDQKEAIFEKFVRGPNAKSGGTGLGLSIARALIQAQGGDVRTVKVPNGARFEIVIPYQEPSE